MGWMSFTLGQLVVTSMVLGTLKRKGTININPQAFKNEQARLVFTKMVSIGEDMSELVESTAKSAYERVTPKVK